MSENEEKKPINDSDSAHNLEKKEHKEKSKKLKDKNTETKNPEVVTSSSVLDRDLAAELARKIQFLQASTSTAARDPAEARTHQYKFWATQPVPEFDSKVTENTHIQAPNDVVLRKEPFTLPENYLWADVDLLDSSQLDELYELLRENYVEDDENMFRFDYSREFLRWALMPVEWLPNWHCGVRAHNGRLLAFIAAVPATIRIFDKVLKMVEINFLCVHKKLRSKRLAPVLIREITRRVNLNGIYQATFTAGIQIPKPIGSCKYWHRSINPRKLIESKFSHLSKNLTMQRTIKLYKLPEKIETTLIPMRKEHLNAAFDLLSNYLQKFHLAPIFSFEEFEHFFMPSDNVIYSYVIENELGVVTDLVSFYCLPSTIVNNPVHKQIKAAYGFYNVATTVSITTLMNDALILANKENFDVFNALDLMENKTFLEELKFGLGDGNLQYYLYNWKCPDLEPSQIGLVLQ